MLCIKVLSNSDVCLSAADLFREMQTLTHWFEPVCAHSYSLMDFSFDLDSNRMISGLCSCAAAISHFGKSRKCPFITYAW